MANKLNLDLSVARKIPLLLLTVAVASSGGDQDYSMLSLVCYARPIAEKAGDVPSASR
jgi:hypothetical protein